MSTGYKHSKETREKISKAHKGRKKSPETCRKLSKAISGSGVDYVVTEPNGTSHIVTNLKEFCVKHWPDNYKNAQSYINITAKTKGTFFKGWTSRFASEVNKG